MNFCIKCSQYKEDSEFYKSKTHKSGMFSKCKSCGIKYALQRRKVKFSYAWFYYNYSKIRINCRNNGKTFNITKDDYKKLVTGSGELCYYCGEENTTGGVDRVDNSIGYVKSNIVSSCYRCNWIKNNLKIDEIYRLKKIYDGMEKFSNRLA